MVRKDIPEGYLRCRVLDVGRESLSDLEYAQAHPSQTHGTVDNFPFNEYLIPESNRQSDRWIDNLVWDPPVDSFYEACKKVSDRILDMDSDSDGWL